MIPPDSGALPSKSSIGALPLFPWIFLKEPVSSSFSHLEEFAFVLFSRWEMLVLRSLTVTLDHQSLYAKDTC